MYKRKIKYAKPILGDTEIANMQSVIESGDIQYGPFYNEFERKFSQYIGVNHSFFVNSGSSANLLAIAALMSRNLPNHLKKGDEVITPACCFPTTVSPILKLGLKPVFVDVELDTLNVSIQAIRDAITPKTRAIVVAHTLGNTFPATELVNLAEENGMWVVEDNCDALGSTYDGFRTGQFGHISTCSFYMAHHISTGEGGMVSTDYDDIAKILRSLRDWGRDCICPPNHDNTCGHRHDGKWGTLPEGFDHKYVYSELGFNLKATEIQAAVGVAQMDRIEVYVEARRRKWQYLKDRVEYRSLEPQENSEPSWFGFVFYVEEKRDQMVSYLERSGIQTRTVFAGNILRHPCMSRSEHRVSGYLHNTDYIMNNALWVGVHPFLTTDDLDYMVEIINGATFT